MVEQYLSATPFTDKMLEKKSEKITSFHALPLGQFKSIVGSALKDKYVRLLGEHFAESEMSYTGKVLDTPVMPKSVLKDSQTQTAMAFGAKETFYITTGTTIANYIAILSSVGPGERVLADRNSHQSIHFALSVNQNKVDYSSNLITDKDSGRNIMNVSDFMDKYKSATERGVPYKLVVLNGCSYEGIIYNIRPIIEKFMKINPHVVFLVDEAWTAYGYFHDFYKKHTAMYIAEKLSQVYPTIKVISTQSAHKSLSTMRQASYIHVYGESYFINEIWKHKYMLHTTSPNYPILATLELARAQMVIEGAELIDRALKNAAKISAEIAKCKKICINKLDSNKWYFCDPCKISVNFSKKNVSAEVICDYLYENGIYVSRKTSNSLLFNIHIGISKKDIYKLISILKKIDEMNFSNVKCKVKYADHYVIAYPPGTPVFLPGDSVEAGECERIKLLEKAGASVIEI